MPWEAIFDIMSDPSEVPDGTELPDKGIDRHKVLKCSAMRIRPFLYYTPGKLHSEPPF